MLVGLQKKVILRLRDDFKGLGFKGKWMINEQIRLIQNLFGLNNPLAC